MDPTNTPKTIAAELAPHWRGTITDVEIAEDMDGWVVRVTIQPTDKRMRAVTIVEYGETRSEAVEAILVHGADAWLDVHNMRAMRA